MSMHPPSTLKLRKALVCMAWDDSPATAPETWRLLSVLVPLIVYTLALNFGDSANSNGIEETGKRTNS